MPRAAPNPIAAGVAVSDSGGELLCQLYSEPRELAALSLSPENPGQTLQATTLFHEAWLRLSRNSERSRKDFHHFLCTAAQTMRRILIENARREQRIRHGGKFQRVNLDDINPASTMQNMNKRSCER